MTSSVKKKTRPIKKDDKLLNHTVREDRCKATGIIGHVWSQQIVCSLGKKTELEMHSECAPRLHVARK